MSNKKERFKIVRKNFGKGKHAKVSIVKRKSDKKLFIWKRPKSDNPDHQRVFLVEHERARVWREIGVSEVHVKWCPDNLSLLKTYVKGYTLAEKLKKDRHFFSKTKRRSVKALRKLFRYLVDSEFWVRDLSTKNLVFDGDKWHVIDSSDIFKMENRSATKQKYKDELVQMWHMKHKKLSSSDIRHIESFFDSI